MSRPDVVAALVSAIGALDGMDLKRMLEQASGEEIHEAVTRLREAALAGAKPVPAVLELNLWQIARLAAQGRALEYVAERLPIWRPWPDKSLADVLKTEPPNTVAVVRETLRRVGLDVDEGETGALDDEPAP
jgi:hypothetical protein